MPRDLSDVLHYFMPELSEEAGGAEARPEAVESTEAPRPEEALPEATLPDALAAALLPDPCESRVLPIVAIPIGDTDVVRAAFTWNLAVEIARMGARAAVIAPGLDDPSPLWPEPGLGPLGAELIPTAANDLGALYRVAIDTAVDRANGARDGGAVLVRIPPQWLRAPTDGAAVLRWTLLFSSSHVEDLRETYGLGKLVLSALSDADVGVTIHGARSRFEAERAFARIAQAAEDHLDRELLSYGLLVDDLHVYRAIVAQKPIGLAHPQSSAARALRDVASTLLDDARKRVVA